MNRSKVLSIILLTLLVFVAARPLQGFAQTRLKHDVFSPGGKSSAGTLVLYDVVGQPLTGASSTAGIRHEAGYLPVVSSYLFATTTAVFITSFETSATQDGVLLSWATSYSEGLRGYNVYRSESATGEFRNLAGGLIPAERGESYEDTNVRPGTTYYYRIGAVDPDGEFLSRTVTVTTPIWRTTLEQNHPNPFNPSTTISFYLSQAGTVSLRIYDTRGRLVRLLIDGPKSSGAQMVDWDGTNDHGETVGSGVYFYRLQAGKDVFTKKMTLLK
jgi:hypothetical protein